MASSSSEENACLNAKLHSKSGDSVEILPAQLSIKTKACYACGHLLNDLTSGIWFTYTLIFLQFIVKLSSTKAGIVMMVGQAVDAFCTPFIGIQSDNRNMLCARNVKRKSWHLLGVVCVGISFPLLFVDCRSCDENSTSVYLGLLLLVAIFQFGWAATQVSHLSLIPEISAYSRERDLLNTLRYTVEEFAELFVFFVAWLIFNLDDNGDKDSETIGEEDASKFTNLVFILTGVGLVFSIVFQLGVEERLKGDSSKVTHIDKRNLVEADVIDETEVTHMEDGIAYKRMPSSQLADCHTQYNSRGWRKWFNDSRFYQVCAVYLFAKMFTNLSATYFPLYLEESLGAPQNMLIYIPLVLNVSGIAACFLLVPVTAITGKKITFALACCISLCGCLVIFLDYSPNFAGRGEYVIAIFMGSGSAAMMAIALAFVPDLLAKDVQNGAFVYGLFSFVEKLVNGITVFATQYLHDILCEDSKPCVWFYRNVMLFLLGVIILAAFVCIVTLFPVKFAQYDRKTVDASWTTDCVEQLKPTDAEIPTFDNGTISVEEYHYNGTKSMHYGSM